MGRVFGREDEFHLFLAQAEYMHRNFYMTGWSEGAVRAAQFGVTRLESELETIRTAQPRAFASRENDDRVKLGPLLRL